MHKIIIKITVLWLLLKVLLALYKCMVHLKKPLGQIQLFRWSVHREEMTPKINWKTFSRRHEKAEVIWHLWYSWYDACEVGMIFPPRSQCWPCTGVRGGSGSVRSAWTECAAPNSSQGNPSYFLYFFSLISSSVIPSPASRKELSFQWWGGSS